MSELTPESLAKVKGTEDSPVWVVASDSEYVVKGITELFAGWKLCCYFHITLL